MIRRETLFPEKKGKLKALKSRSSFSDIAALGIGQGGSNSPPSPQLLLPQRSLSYGHSPQQLLHCQELFPARKDAYQLISECGQGATAKVWRGRCIPLRQEVAIKMVDLENAGQNLETIIHEAQLLYMLRHPNVLSLLACFVVDHYLWMILPYIPGGSVESAMNYAFPKGVDEQIIAPIMMQVLKALEYLHKQGIAHRDVKASNILLDHENVVLGDFGIAVNMERRLDHCSKADFGRYLCRTTFVGTPVWMAPEVIEQACGHDTKADIYSFGMTMLEMARGKAPFAGMPFEVVAMNKLHHPSPSLPSVQDGRHYSEDMQEVVAMCLQKDPKKRPNTTQLLKHRFFKWTRPCKEAVEELLAGIPGPVQRLSSLTRRNKENGGGALDDDYNPFAGDERLSFNSLKVKDAQQATQRFDADNALALLHKMLASNGIQPSMGSSPDNTSPSPNTPKSNGSTPRIASLSKRRGSFARGNLWPNLPACALQHCKGILFASAGRKGFGLQTTWGHGFVMSHMKCDSGMSCWSGPCYVYLSGAMHLGVGENIRESIVLYSNQKPAEMLKSYQVFKMSDLELLDAVEGNLDAASICAALQDRSSPTCGVAFRHYSGTKAWKQHGIVHLDNAANEKVYGRPLDCKAILMGTVPPPASFRALIDTLIACEEGRYEQPAPDIDSDASNRSNRSLKLHYSGPISPTRVENRGAELKAHSSLPSPTTTSALDTAYGVYFEGESPLAPSSSAFMSAVPEGAALRFNCTENEAGIMEARGRSLRESLSEPTLHSISPQLNRLPALDSSTEGASPWSSSGYSLPTAVQSPFMNSASTVSQRDSALDLASLDQSTVEEHEGHADEQESSREQHTEASVSKCMGWQAPDPHPSHRDHPEQGAIDGRQEPGDELEEKQGGVSPFMAASSQGGYNDWEGRALETEHARNLAAGPLGKSGKLDKAWRPPKPPRQSSIPKDTRVKL